MVGFCGRKKDPELYSLGSNAAFINLIVVKLR